MKAGVVEIPVRIVGGEAEDIGSAGGLEHLPEELVVSVRVLGAPRVAREPEVRLAAEPVPLACLHVGEELLEISDLRVDVAVDHASRSLTRGRAARELT
jgi:hypothetical protein